LGIVTGSLIARLLGPEGRGVLAAIQNWPTLVVGFGTLGIPTAAAYFSGRDPTVAGRLLTTCLIALFLWSIPLITVTYVLMPLLLNAQSASVIYQARVYLLIIPIQFAIGVPFWVLQGLREFRLWNFLRLQGPLAWLTVIVLAWTLHASTGEAVSFIYLIIMAWVASIFMVVALWRVPSPHQLSFSRLPALLQYGLPSILANLPQLLNLRLDQLLIAAVLPAHTLGVYVVAVAWSGISSPLLTSVSQVIFPHLAATHDRQTQAETLQRTLRLSVLSVTVLTGLLLAVTPIFLPLLFGKAFVAAVPPAFVLIVAAGAAGINQVASEGLRGLGVPKWPMVAEFVGLSITIILLVLLLRRYQLMGAAIASLFSYLGTLVTLVSLIGHQTQTSPWKIVIPRRQDLSFLWYQVYSFWPRLVSLLYYNRK